MFLIVGGVGTPAAAFADEPVHLNAIDGWVLDYADDSCALRRTFGTQEAPVFLEVRQFSQLDEFQLTVATGAYSSRRAAPLIGYVPDAEEYAPSGAIFARFGEGVEGVIVSDTLHPVSVKEQIGKLAISEYAERQDLRKWSDESRAEREAAISGILLRDTFAQDLLLDTGTLHRPFEAMRGCIDELLTHWGIDAEAHHSLTREAGPTDPASTFRRLWRGYPSNMLRRELSAMLRVRLAISAEGAVDGCHLQMEVADHQFEEAVCRILGRERFIPALDAAGQPLRSYWVTSITYLMN